MNYLLLALLLGAAQGADGQEPKTAYVPDAPTAVRIAEAVLMPLYGKAIRGERPLKATLENDSVWVVHSSRHTKGGCYVEISKATGRILQAERGK